MTYLPGVLERRDPASQPAPLVFDIPRSGTCYPCEFAPTAPFNTVHQSVSMHVQKLYEGVVEHGASWLYAHFPNTYIDANRHETDIDPELLDGTFPTALQPSEKSRLGIGLIHSKCGPTGEPLYDRKLTIADVQKRISGYFLPYHNLLTSMLDEHRKTHGVAYHVSCHSMASIGGASTLDKGSPRVDFDIGDRHGTTCEPAFRDLVIQTLSGFGYNVTANFHYPGAESIRRHAAPEAGIHSLQIEVKRGLYMDEKTFMPHEGFERVRHHLTELSKVLAQYAREQSAR